ncbi:MAG: helix-turn-helix domain-containing protein [Xanthomonadales bacterium]|nr:helix-turn-helix domain-containing protein [Xanthomonadales bacterium]
MGSVARYYHEEICSKQLQTKLNELIELSYHRADLKNSCLAKQLGLSNRDLNRKCKEHFQMTPKAYLTDYRLNKAIEFILEGQAVGNIAFDVGFSTHSSFGRSFKRHFGCSPSEYTEKYMHKYAQNSDLAENG